MFIVLEEAPRDEPTPPVPIRVSTLGVVEQMAVPNNGAGATLVEYCCGAADGVPHNSTREIVAECNSVDFVRDFEWDIMPSVLLKL